MSEDLRLEVKTSVNKHAVFCCIKVPNLPVHIRSLTWLNLSQVVVMCYRENRTDIFTTAKTEAWHTHAYQVADVSHLSTSVTGALQSSRSTQTGSVESSCDSGVSSSLSGLSWSLVSSSCVSSSSSFWYGSSDLDDEACGSTDASALLFTALLAAASSAGDVTRWSPLLLRLTWIIWIKYNDKFLAIILTEKPNKYVRGDWCISTHADPTSTWRAIFHEECISTVMFMQVGVARTLANSVIPCFRRQWTAVQNLMPLALSSAEKSLIVQIHTKNKQIQKQTNKQ